MKKVFFLGLLLSAAVAGIAQSTPQDQLKSNFSKTWKAGYMLVNGMRIEAKAGIPMIIFEFKSDNTLLTYAASEPGNKMAGSWKYLADKKQVQIKVLGAERGFVTSFSSEEMSMSINSNQMGAGDGSEMILMLSPVN